MAARALLCAGMTFLGSLYPVEYVMFGINHFWRQEVILDRMADNCGDEATGQWIEYKAKP